MNGKFWAINFIAFFIIISYTVEFFYHTIKGVQVAPFWEASPFQVVFMVAFFYLVSEGKLVQKLIIAKRLKDEGTHKEFAIVNKTSESFDRMFLDKFKKE